MDKGYLRRIGKGFARGYEPLLFDTLPKMPCIRDVVPCDIEPVIPVGTNPVGPTAIPG